MLNNANFFTSSCTITAKKIRVMNGKNRNGTLQVDQALAYIKDCWLMMKRPDESERDIQTESADSCSPISSPVAITNTKIHAKDIPHN